MVASSDAPAGLHEGEHPRDGGDEEGCGGGGEEASQAPAGAPLVVQGTVCLLPRGVEERPLVADQVVPPGCQIEGGGEPRAAVEVVVAVPAVRPVRGGGTERPLCDQAGAVLIDPVAQSWPVLQQGLVGDFGAVPVDGDQARVHESGQHVVGDLPTGRIGLQLVQAGPPSAVEAGLRRLHQPQGDPLGAGSSVAVESAVELLGGAGERPAGAACGPVPGDGEGPAVPPFPGGAQRVTEQRQRTGGAGQVGDDQIGQARLDREPRAPRGLGHHPPDCFGAQADRGGSGQRRPRPRARGARRSGRTGRHGSPRRLAPGAPVIASSRRARCSAASIVNASSNWSTTTSGAAASAASPTASTEAGVTTTRARHVRGHAGAQQRGLPHS